MSDVSLIVGAGPVGLMLASLFTKYGVPFRLIDENPAPVIQTKAAGLWSRTLEAFHHLGIDQAILDVSHRSYQAHTYSGGEERVRMNLSKIPSFYNFVTLLPQHRTEHVLTEELRKHGVEAERGLRLLHLDGGTATIEEVASGTTQRETYRYIFGTDGAHSRVRKEIGATFQGDKLPGCWLVADMIARGDELPEDEVSMFMGPHGPFALFALGESRYRVVASSPEPLEEITLEFFQKSAEDSVPFPIQLSDPQHMQAFSINERQADKYSNGTAFLLGDAAHIHSPAGGQGVNTGMQDAFNLAWKVAQVVRWGSSPALLETYHQERHPVARRVLETTGLAMRAVTITNPIGQKLRSAAMGLFGNLEPVQSRIRAGMAQLDVHYGESALNLAEGTNKLDPGDRVPEVFWRDAQSRSHRLHDLFCGLHWTLLTRGESPLLPSVDPARLQRIAITRLGVSSAVRYSDPASDLVDALGLEPGSHLLVRPDGYLAGVFEAGAEDLLLAYWQRHCANRAALPT